MRRTALLAALLLAGLWFEGGCGYHTAQAGRTPLPIRTLAVEPLRNETSTFKIEQVLTRALVRAFVSKTGYRVVNDPAGADAVLSGVVRRVTANPVLFGQQTFGRTFLVTVSLKVTLKARRTGRVLFQNDHFIFREQYVLNSDVENFFSELNPALKRLASDFAESVVTTILEGF